jgi:hypothetical protein
MIATIPVLATKPDVNTNEGLQEYIRRLLKTPGVEKLGRGGSAVVFGLPGQNVAVRVSSKSDAGVKWLTACKTKLKNNPWVPKVLSIHRVTKKGKFTETYYILAGR